MLKLLLLPLILGAALASDDVILEPLAYKVGLPQASLVLFQGAFVEPAEYSNFIREVQSRLPLELWGAIPAFPSNLAVYSYGYYSTVVPRVFATLQSRGLAAGSPAFYAGHSLGGSNGLTYMYNLNASQVAGYAQISSAPGREFDSGTFPHPHLTISGELDRLLTVSRLAETYFHHVIQAGSAEVTQSPVIYVPGANHMTGWTSGATSGVKAFDLRTELTDENALASFADIVSDFFVAVSPSGLIDKDLVKISKRHVSEHVDLTGKFLAPLLASLEIEGSSRLNSTAPQSSPAALLATPVMAALSGKGKYKVSVDDVEVFSAADFALESAEITFSCALARKSKTCAVGAATASQPVYSSDYYSYAAEIRMKMPSRQAFARASYDAAADASLDSESICSQINAKMIAWARSVVGSSTLSRFDKVGQQIVVGDDIAVANSTAWVSTSITLQSVIVNNATVLQVLSPSFFSPIGSADLPGVHFCKVLSPAYIMDWIYTNGLFLNYNLASA